MKSNKIKKKEMSERESKKIEKNLNVKFLESIINRTAIITDKTKLRSCRLHPVFPDYYMDKEFICKKCGAKEIWTAQKQKIWYEVQGGDIDSTAIYCHDCRIAKRNNVKQK